MRFIIALSVLIIVLLGGAGAWLTSHPNAVASPIAFTSVTPEEDALQAAVAGATLANASNEKKPAKVPPLAERSLEQERERARTGVERARKKLAKLEAMTDAGWQAEKQKRIVQSEKRKSGEMTRLKDKCAKLAKPAATKEDADDEEPAL